MTRYGRLAWLALALAPGCGGLGLEPMTDTGTAALRVDDIDPGYGPTSGQTQVAVTGAGFTGAVSVRFGNGVGDVTVLDANTLSVLAPDAEGLALTVDVVVSSALGEVTVEDGFVYTDDTIPDTDDTGAGIDGVGGIVEFSLLQVACPGCWTPPQDELQVGAFAAFHQPVGGTWTGWLPDPGSCVENPSSPQPTSSFVDVGQNVFLTAGSRSLGLTRTTVGGDVQYDAGALEVGDFPQNTSFDLEAADGGAWGSFIVPDVLTTGQYISELSQPEYTPQPQALILSNPNQAFTRGLLHYPIVYSPYGGEGTFVVILGFYSGNDGSFLGQVVCRDYDTGTFTLHEAYANAAPTRSLVVVSMYRYLIAWTPNEASGSYIESAVSIGVVGTASI